MNTVLAYAKKPVGAVMMRPILLRLLEDPRFRVHGTARLFGRRDAGSVFSGVGLGAVHQVPKWLARLTAYDLYLSADFTIAAPRARRRVHVFHGVSFRNHGVHENALRYDLLLLAGPYMRRRFEEMGLIDDANDERFPIVGMPKLDDLANGVFVRRDVLERLGLDPARPTVLYAPTWSRRVSSLEYHGEALLRALASSGQNVIVKLHDNSLDRRKAGRDWAALLASLESVRFRFSRDADIAPLMAAADVLVSDASSVANEFALLDRPILFMRIEDLPSRLKAKADLETWGLKAGTVVDGPDAIASAIDDALAHPSRLSDVRTALARDLFFEPGTATSRAVDAICRLLEIGVE